MIKTSTLTVAQAGALLDRSERWIQQRAAEGWIRKTERGQYALVPLIRGAIAYQEDQLAKARKASDATRATAARTREIELRIADRMNDLMPQTDARAVVDGLQVLYRREFSGLPARFTKDRKRRRELGVEVDATLAWLDDAADRARQKLATGFDE